MGCEAAVGGPAKPPQRPGLLPFARAPTARRPDQDRRRWRALDLAIGCPVCNKVVVLLLGAAGALNISAPLQPVLGLLPIGLLGWALRTRLVGEPACPLSTTSP